MGARKRKTTTAEPGPVVVKRPARKMTVSTPEEPAVTPGTVDVWPILRASPAALVREIEAGDHDRMLSELLAVAGAHGCDGGVIAALRARLGGSE